MKASSVGVVSAAILMVVAGVGFGIAQAVGTDTIGEFMEWQTLEQGSSSSSYVETRPVLAFEDQEIPQVAKSPADDMQLASDGQEFIPEGNWSGTDWQARGPVETGAIPVTVFEESWMKGYGND